MAPDVPHFVQWSQVPLAPLFPLATGRWTAVLMLFCLQQPLVLSEVLAECKWPADPLHDQCAEPLTVLPCRKLGFPDRSSRSSCCSSSQPHVSAARSNSSKNAKIVLRPHLHEGDEGDAIRPQSTSPEHRSIFMLQLHVHSDCKESELYFIVLVSSTITNPG